MLGKSEPEISVGIDFGTSNSCSGVYINGVVKIVPNKIGERITPYNASTLKTLEKYRYLISGINDPSDGGFVASVESLKGVGLSKEYSVQEILESLIEIANSFATTEEIEYNLRTYLEQLQQMYTDTKSNAPKK